MAFTYLVLNCIFFICIVGMLVTLPHRPSKNWWAMLVVLLLLTVIFDSIIIGADIVAYDLDKILGLYIGLAPVEDFFYAILAAVIVPVLWGKFAPAKPAVKSVKKGAEL